MKVALFKAYGEPLEITNIPDPKPGAGELVVRMLAAPVASYAREVFNGTRPYPLLLPLVPGVGGIGVVEEVGPDATRLRPGQLVFCDATVRSRDDAVSPDVMLQGWIAPGEGAQRMQSHFRHGAFAERMLLPLENATVLNGLDAYDPVKLAWLATPLVPYGGFLAANLQAGQTVAVVGATGHFGSAGVAVALAMGSARVVALGRDAGRLKMLTDLFGARVLPVVLSGEEAQDRESIKQSAGAPLDCVLDMLSPVQDFTPVRAAILALRSGGTAVLMGGVMADIALPYREVMRRSLVVRGQYMYPRFAVAQLAGMVRAGLLDLQPFEVHAFGLDQANEAVEYAAQHGGAFHLTVLTP